MSNADKNILITPNRGSTTGDPRIDFVGANSTTAGQTITLNALPINNGTLSFEGSAGQLFSITNDLTGTIFSVNDVSGIPSIAVDADGTVSLAEFSGNVGIGTNSPAAKLHVENGSTGYSWTPNIRTAAIIEGNNSVGTTLSIIAPSTGYSGIFFGDEALESTGQIQHFHTDNRLNFYATHHTFQNGSGVELVRITTAGNVGIGTTNPDTKLKVAGEINSSSATNAGRISFGDTSNNIAVYRDNSGDLVVHQGFDSGKALYLGGLGDVVVSIDSNNNQTGKAFRVRKDNLKAGTELFTVLESGNVGIGTTIPDENLHIFRDLKYGLMLQRNSFTDNAENLIRFSNSGASGVYSSYIGSTRAAGLNGAGHLVFGTAPFISVGTDGVTERMRITPAGNVGIGTNNPTEKLHVKGGSLLVQTDAGTDILADFSSNVAGNGRIQLVSNAGNPAILLNDFGNGTGGDQSWGIVANDRNAGSFTINWYGNSLPGTNVAGGVEMFTIVADTGGRVGIGSTNPQAKLDVNGDIIVKSNITYTSPDGLNQIVTRMLNSDTLSFSGNTGQLFSISDNATGTIFSVNDISGVPSIEVIDDGTVILAETFGNVGIGVNNPVSPLHIVTATPGTEHPEGMITIHNTTLGGESAIRYINSSTTTGSWYAGLNNTDRFQIAFGTSFGTATNNNNIKLTITTVGNVGIGRSTPEYSLDITRPNHNVARFVSTGTNTGPDVLIVDHDNNNARASLQIQGNAGSTEVLFAASGGNVGIGTVTPSQKLQVVGTVLATAFSGPLTGNATTATTLQTARTINGISFNGSTNITLPTVNTSGNQTVAGIKTFSSRVSVPRAGDTTGAATGVDLNAQGSGYLFGTTGDAASSTVANVKLTSWFGIGFAPTISGQAVPQWENAAWINVRNGAFFARNEVTAYASDERLKTNFVPIQTPLEKIQKISGYEFDWQTEKCLSLGFAPSNNHEHGLKAQEIEKIVPDAVKIAPFDNNGNGESKSGEKYLTVQYEKLVPLLIESIKAQQTQIDQLREEIENLKGNN